MLCFNPWQTFRSAGDYDNNESSSSVGLNTKQLEERMKCLISDLQNECSSKLNFLGVFPRDQFPFQKELLNINNSDYSYPVSVYQSSKPIHQSYFCIVNSDPSSMAGTHWLAAFLDNSFPSRTLEFFDSYGSPPDNYLIPVECNRYKVVYNKKSLQSYSSTACGHYCLLFLYLRILIFISCNKQSPQTCFRSVIKSIAQVAPTAPQRDAFVVRLVNEITKKEKSFHSSLNPTNSFHSLCNHDKYHSTSLISKLLVDNQCCIAYHSNNLSNL